MTGVVAKWRLYLRKAVSGFVAILAGAVFFAGCDAIPANFGIGNDPEPTANLSETMYWLLDDASLRLSTQLAYEMDRRFETLVAGGVIRTSVPIRSDVTPTPDRPVFSVTSVPDAIRTKQAAEARGLTLRSDCENSMTFVSDVSIPDYSAVSAGKPFTKTWRVRNSGTCDWTEEYAIVFDMGDRMDGAERTNLPAGTVVRPNELVELSVYMTAPEKHGSYAGYWKLEDGLQNRFGTGSDSSKALWVKVEVK